MIGLRAGELTDCDPGGSALCMAGVGIPFPKFGDAPVSSESGLCELAGGRGGKFMTLSRKGVE